MSEIEFDPAKDRRNLAKHGISLDRAKDLEIVKYLPDERFTREPRFRAWGFIGGKAYCLAYTHRDDRLRAISLRRASKKEMERYVSQEEGDG
jgi:uncharacterized DUF497 family protein